jgi:hypothetical protein
MYQTIAETIEVVGIYRQGKFQPVKFKWQGRVFPVQEITLVADLKNGGVRGRQYSVVSGGNVYRLYFNRDQENWQLKELWVE